MQHSIGCYFEHFRYIIANINKQMRVQVLIRKCILNKIYVTKAIIVYNLKKDQRLHNWHYTIYSFKIMF